MNKGNSRRENKNSQATVSKTLKRSSRMNQVLTSSKNNNSKLP